MSSKYWLVHYESDPLAGFYDSCIVEADTLAEASATAKLYCDEVVYDRVRYLDEELAEDSDFEVEYSGVSITNIEFLELGEDDPRFAENHLV